MKNNTTSKEKDANSRQKIIFISGIGKNDEFGGELTKNKEILSRFQELGLLVSVIDTYQCRKSKKKLLKVFFQFFWRILSNLRATIVFSTSFKNIYTFLKILYYFPIRRRVVIWVIGGNLSLEIEKNEYAFKYLSFVHKFLVEGEKMKVEMNRMGIKNVMHVPNFKTIKELPSVQKEDGCISFLFLSRITPEKGCRYIIEAVEILNKKGLGDRFSVDFYGSIEQNYWDEFKNGIERNSNISYKGTLQLQNSQNYNILSSYHYMIFPTYWKGEGFPGVIIDAYKCGVPVLASDWNFNDEFVKHGVTGILYKTHSLEELCTVLEKAIDRGYDFHLLSRNCQKVVWEYDTKNVITYDLVKSILN